MSDPISFEEHAAEGGHARRILLRRLIDFIAMPASQVAPQDRSMGGDILLDMLFHATDTERMQCARRIASHKIAQFILFLPELPKGAQNKILRNEVKQLIGQDIAKARTRRRSRS